MSFMINGYKIEYYESNNCITVLEGDWNELYSISILSENINTLSLWEQGKRIAEILHIKDPERF